jgi:hypothetical protein
MALTERFYSCELVEVPTVGPFGGTTKVPAMSQEPMLAHGFVQRDLGEGDVVWQFAATASGWSQFDAAYPNQDAQTGAPYRRRYPRKDLPSVTFIE